MISVRSSHLVPNQELSVIFNSQYWLYHGDDEELEDEALLEQGLELWEGVWDAEVRVGAVEGVEDVAQLFEVILEGLKERELRKLIIVVVRTWD